MSPHKILPVFLDATFTHWDKELALEKRKEFHSNNYIQIVSWLMPKNTIPYATNMWPVSISLCNEMKKNMISWHALDDCGI